MSRIVDKVMISILTALKSHAGCVEDNVPIDKSSKCDRQMINLLYNIILEKYYQ